MAFTETKRLNNKDAASVVENRMLRLVELSGRCWSPLDQLWANSEEEIDSQRPLAGPILSPTH